MKVDRINNSPNFGIKVDAKFIKDAQRYYTNRMLPLQYDTFNKTVEKLEYVGSDSSVIFHTTAPNNKKLHLLCIKNEGINNKSAAIITKSDKYNDILRFFSSITTAKAEGYEDALKSL